MKAVSLKLSSSACACFCGKVGDGAQTYCQNCRQGTEDQFKLIPTQFGDWKIDATIATLLVNLKHKRGS